MSAELVESVTGLLELDAADAASLNVLGRQLASDRSWWGAERDAAEDERTVIRCYPAANGQFGVTVSDAVGAVCAGGRVIPVLPKIPQEHFWQIVKHSERWPRIAPEAIQMGGGSLLDILGHWFLASLERALRGDLVFDYREEIAELRQIRGRLDLLPSCNSYYRGNLALQCEYEEFDGDTPLNRVLRAAVQSVARMSIFGETLRRRARGLLFTLSGVSDLRPDDLSVETDRRSDHFRDALFLAKEIVRNQGRRLNPGNRKSWVFLIRTPEIIENGIRNVLSRALADISKVGKRGRQLDHSAMTVNPDLVFEGRNAIGDVKYKLGGLEWGRPDLYQAVAFAAAYRVSRACVISFGPDSPRPARANFGDISATALRWNTDASPSDAEVQLAAECRQWLAVESAAV